MKKLISIIFLVISSIANATNYFLSNAGNDGNAGTSTGAPWASITKVNGFAFNPGDSISFNRGDVWIGTALAISRSGASGNLIKLGSYGTGANPIISGFSTLSSWTSIGGGLYTATVPGGLSTLGVVTFDGAFQPMGRMPKGNTAYYNVTSATATNITSTGTSTNNPNSFASAPSCVGGEVVWRPKHWVLWNGTISAQTSTSVTFSAFAATSGGAEENPAPGFGFFLQNHPNCCTALGEWAYNGSTHVITMFFGGGGPGSHIVKATSVDITNNLVGRSFISFTNIDFLGGNTSVVSLNGSSTIKFNGCTVSFAGEYGIFANGTSPNLSFINSTMSWISSNGIRYSSGSAASTITGSTFTNIGAVAGMGGSGEGQYFGIINVKDGSVVVGNVMKNIGYNAITFQGTNNRVALNFIDSFCTVKDDGGGIYFGAVSAAGTRVDSNIVINGIGAHRGTTESEERVHGVYGDDGASNCEIGYNTFAMNGGGGINLHNTHEITMSNNTCFDNANSAIIYYNDGNTIANISLNNNIFFAKTASQFVHRSSGGAASPVAFFSSANNNFWCRPLNENADFQILVPTAQTFNLATWKTFTGKESNSKITPIPITDVNKIRFEYNATASPAVVSLGVNSYMDVTGVIHSTNITLPAYTSAVLLQTTATNSLPSTTAGPDITLTLPTNSATMAGNATDVDGTISNYLWAKISGGAATITNSGLKTTTITGLVQGIYQFQLTATDNSGGSTSDIMQITVNAAANVLPVAHAGSDIAITLPVKTVTVTGSGTDADGTIVAYNWSQVGTTPSLATIVSVAQAQTVINNLGTSGTYKFVLKVTDNTGATATDTMSVVVSPPANIPPVVSAGANINVTSPTSSTSVTGTATDPDGSIASVKWTFVSGPGPTATFGTSAVLTTTVNGMTSPGSYTLRLTAKDNSGDSTSDDVVVQVNAAANVLPVAHAGADIAITLPVKTVTVTGSGTDADGSIVAYNWSQVGSTPSLATIVSVAQAQTVINNLGTSGTYKFVLKVIDNTGATATDTMSVVVSPPANIPPVVSAGANINVTSPTSSTSVTGTATDPDGSIASVKWTFVSGPGPTATFGTPTTLATTVSGMITVGSYTLRLTAKDNSGDSTSDDVVVQVNAAANVLPVAHAGADQVDTFIVTGNTIITLTGSGTDADGTIAGYTWSEISGPNIATIVSPSQGITTITNYTAGTYGFRLTVRDNSGGTGTDDVTIIIYEAPQNTANPVANAGPDIRGTMCFFFCNTASVTAIGSGTDPGSVINSYQWTKISGPSQYTIGSPNSPTTTFGNLARGTYVFQLTVTDARGLTNSDLVTVTIFKQRISVRGGRIIFEDY